MINNIVIQLPSITNTTDKHICCINQENSLWLNTKARISPVLFTTMANFSIASDYRSKSPKKVTLFILS